MARSGRWLEAVWQTRGLASTLLLPLALLFGGVSRVRRTLYGIGWWVPERLAVPVIVIGNITVGGTGKTPLVIALIDALRAAGLTPGVVSRGYRGEASATALWSAVETNDARRYGDEIVLVRERTGVAAAVGRRRAEAGRGLLAQHPEIDVLVCDDGLQHYALARDCEVAVFDGRGAGNARLLPAGPCREPVSRLAQVDALVFNGAPEKGQAVLAAMPPAVPRFSMRIEARHAFRLSDAKEMRPLASFRGEALLAAAGIGVPARFFALLAAAGLSFQELPLPDHFDYAVNPFAGRSEKTILITEKDAVKCRRLGDARLWVVPVDAVLEEGFVALVLEKIRARK